MGAGFFDARQRATVEAAMARIIPTDDQPGAREAGTIDFLDRYLSGLDHVYAKPDGSGFETLEGKRAEAWQRRIDILRARYLDGVEELDRRSRARFGGEFAGLDPTRQDQVLSDLERSTPETGEPVAEAKVAAGHGAPVEPALRQTSSEVELDFFPLLCLHTRQGFYADPIYGGNRDRVGWEVIGFPGPKSLAEVHSGRYSALPWFAEAAASPEGRSSVAPRTKPQRADACIIGAGASGATAAKVLTERGLRVVALERGPWRKRESFGGDELANVNRYNLWPDPLLNPRTVRASASEEPRVELFCPVPQMVGGGTVHWQGWLPRLTEHDFRLRSIVGDLPGTTLADWPISYQELEPYYTQIEWALGVSGQAGANTFESPRSRGYPCPPMPTSRYAQKFHGQRAGDRQRQPVRPPVGHAADQRAAGARDQRR